jgi:hypothetical protein
MKSPIIEVLVFDGCPNVDLAVERARAAVATAGVVGAEVRLVRVEGEESALEQRFLGSPTVRVDGRDVEPGADARGDFGLQCRLYAVEGRFDGAPPVEWIRAALGGEMANAPAPPVGVEAASGCCSGAKH